eukprot:2989146-Lingulodinium_polyedra.AAC.1
MLVLRSWQQVRHAGLVPMGRAGSVVPRAQAWRWQRRFGQVPRRAVAGRRAPQAQGRAGPARRFGAR